MRTKSTSANKQRREPPRHNQQRWLWETKNQQTGHFGAYKSAGFVCLGFASLHTDATMRK